ncbi:MAG TPA: alpha/beta hydrolase, partial [Saprospiraceae bacterium]|nr:alpha/beta hydrolase [Saprospiraceae bacterium]
EGGYEWKMNYPLLEKSYQSILSEVGSSSSHFDRPTLFVKGAFSPYITGGDEVKIQKQFPNSRLTTIQNAGHWVHADQPEQFTRQVLQFLNQNLST